MSQLAIDTFARVLVRNKSKPLSDLSPLWCRASALSATLGLPDLCSHHKEEPVLHLERLLALTISLTHSWSNLGVRTALGTTVS